MRIKKEVRPVFFVKTGLVASWHFDFNFDKSKDVNALINVDAFMGGGVVDV